MNTEKSKQYHIIGCCGIDCGLCPRFNSIGVSACPGCCGTKFKEKHPSCGVVTCCVNKNEYETCAECINYPCQKFMTKSAGHDSFVTHKMAHYNLEFIKKEGIIAFMNQQRIRIDTLSYFLQECNDGRSKNFYCLSCALLPIDKLQECHDMVSHDDSIDIRGKCKKLKEHIQILAKELKIDLELDKK